MEVRARCGNKKRGFTLLEMIAAVSVTLIITSVSAKVVAGYIRDYFVFDDKSAELDGLDNCMVNIDNMLRENYTTDIVSEGNSLIITSKLSHSADALKKKVIYQKDSRLVVRTLINNKEDITVGNNVLLKDVEMFYIYKKQNLIYFKIISKKGEVRIRCI